MPDEILSNHAVEAMQRLCVVLRSFPAQMLSAEDCADMIESRIASCTKRAPVVTMAVKPKAPKVEVEKLKAGDSAAWVHREPKTLDETKALADEIVTALRGQNKPMRAGEIRSLLKPTNHARWYSAVALLESKGILLRKAGGNRDYLLNPAV